MRALTNAAGAVTDTYEYDAFGNHWTAEGSTPNNMLYQGEEWDPDLSLLYLRARYMNPFTGRFLSRDPEDGDYSDPATLHKYTYASSDPVDRVDPSGRASFAENLQTFTIAVGATAGLLAVQHEINCYYNWNGTNTGANVSAGAFGQVAQIGPCTWQGLKTIRPPEPWAYPGQWPYPVPTPWPVPGTPPSPQPPRCKELRGAVNAAKDAVGNLGACEPSDLLPVLETKYAAWVALGIARAQEDKVCFNGGNWNHQDEERKAWQNVANCASLIAAAQ